LKESCNKRKWLEERETEGNVNFNINIYFLYLVINFQRYSYSIPYYFLLQKYNCHLTKKNIYYNLPLFDTKYTCRIFWEYVLPYNKTIKELFPKK
jgi:hypothetical protein